MATSNVEFIVKATGDDVTSKTVIDIFSSILEIDYKFADISITDEDEMEVYCHGGDPGAALATLYRAIYFLNKYKIENYGIYIGCSWDMGYDCFSPCQIVYNNKEKFYYEYADIAPDDDDTDVDYEDFYDNEYCGIYSIVSNNIENFPNGREVSKYPLEKYIKIYFRDPDYVTAKDVTLLEKYEDKIIDILISSWQQDKSFDFSKLDESFPKHRFKSAKTKLALFRLKNPVGMTDDAKKRYYNYLSGNAHDAVLYCIDINDMESLVACGDAGALKKSNIDEFIKYAADNKLTEFTAYLLDYKNLHFTAKNPKTTKS